MRRPSAPVKAPLAWPKISDSMISAGTAAQLMPTKGPSRPLIWWTRRATISLPVPDSPVISTVASVAATWSTLPRTLRVRSSSAMKSPVRRFTSSALGLNGQPAALRSQGLVR